MCNIIENREVIPGHHLLCLEAPEIAVAAQPGQFLHIRRPDGFEPLLRRPLSVHRVDRNKGRVYLFYRVSGRGTGLLSRSRAGDLLDILGPLGRGYTLPSAGEKVAVIGGGIGFVPLYFLLEEIERTIGSGSTAVFLGAAAQEALPVAAAIRGMGFQLYIATDDGSAGFRGTVLELYAKEAGPGAFDRVYACGPTPMLKELAAAVGPGPVAEVSVEERMACGVGACLSCVCRVKDDGGEGSRYAHVCRDGPVFDLRELVF